MGHGKQAKRVRDYGNPSSLDSTFPTLRNKDWFVGRSFAASLFTFEYSPTYEAVNAYYAMYLLGLVFNDGNMFNGRDSLRWPDPPSS